MIKNLLNIFIPEAFKGATLLPLRTLAITFKKDSVIGTVIVQKGTTYFVENIVHQKIGSDSSQKNNPLVSALKDLAGKVENYDKIVTTISSSFVTFKELSLPFTSEEKIKMVLPFEIESLLPFDAFHACIDFIITKKNIEEKKSDIIVAAIQKKYIQDLTDLFEQADLEISSITTDIIALYGLYSRREATNEGNTAFIELGETESKIAFFIDGQLKHIRTIQQTFDPGKENETAWNKIIFTLQSFKSDTATGGPLTKIILFGELCKDLAREAEEKLDAPCEYFDIKQFTTKVSISMNSKIKSDDINLSGLATALPLPKGQPFSLRQEELTQKESLLFSQQIITGGALILTLLCLAGGHTFYTIHKLTAEKDQSEKEIIQTLKKNFPSMKKTTSLSAALDEAHREVRKEESIWSSLSEQTRQSYLSYLSIISTNIEREVLGLNLNKLIINKNIITLEGSVRNFEAIDQFEQQLKATKMFSHVPDLQSIEFSTPLTLNNQGGIS
jgi:type II secretory pathway component PulL